MEEHLEVAFHAEEASDEQVGACEHDVHACMRKAGWLRCSPANDPLAGGCGCGWACTKRRSLLPSECQKLHASRTHVLLAPMPALQNVCVRTLCVCVQRLCMCGMMVVHPASSTVAACLRPTPCCAGAL